MISLKYLETLQGKEVGCSRWLLMDQERIGLFGDVTGAPQFIYVDVKRHGDKFCAAD